MTDKESTSVYDHKRNSIEFFLKVNLEESKFDGGEEDEHSDCIEKALDLALKDATNQGAFNGKLVKEDRPDRQEADRRAKKILRNSIRELRGKIISEPEVDMPNEYDKWVKRTCAKLVDGEENEEAPYKGYERINPVDTNDKRAFTYGNAQKFVNMAMKYLYVFEGIMSACSCGIAREDLHKLFYGDVDLRKYLHVPIDNIVLGKASRQMGKKSEWGSKRPLLDRASEHPGQYLSIKKENNKSYWICLSGKDYCRWSTIPCFKTYMSLQRKLRANIESEIKGVSPIDWECYVWQKRNG